MTSYPLHGAKIGTRLAACFVMIVVAMLAADAVAVWHFRMTAAPAEQLAKADRISLAVIRVHFDIDTFKDNLAALASTRDIRRFKTEGALLRESFVENIAQCGELIESSADAQQDPAIRTALETLRVTLPSQIDTTLDLASAGDWAAVDHRMSNQVQALVQLSSLLVQKVEAGLAQERAEAIESGYQARRQLVLILPAAALLTLLIAVVLGWNVTRSIIDPLSQLEAGARALAKGDFGHRVAIRGEDELAELGRVLNDSAQQLAVLYETLRSNEARFRLTIDTIPAFVWSALPDGSVDFINRRWLEFSGLSLEQGLGFGWKIAVHPEDRTHFLEVWTASVASGKAMEHEARFRRADGQYRWLLIRNVPLHDKEGTIVKWYSTCTDIHDRKRAEEERERLRQLEADLAHINRVSMMGELSASIAHEVNQPLTGIVSNGSACLRFLAGDTPNLDETRDAVRDIVRDGKRAGEVIARIRSLTKRETAAEERLDLNATIADVLVLVADEAKRMSVLIETRFADALFSISGDRVQLQQVMLNLVMNGIEAMSGTDEGRRHLAITTRNIDEGHVQVTVQDSGFGIDPNSVDRIFDPFYTTKPGGMGMGLSICRSIVQNHGGRLWATPNGATGTSFHFTIPMCQGIRGKS